MDKRVICLMLATVLLCIGECLFRIHVLGLGLFDKVSAVAWRDPGQAVVMALMCLAGMVIIYLLMKTLNIIGTKKGKDEIGQGRDNERDLGDDRPHRRDHPMGGSGAPAGRMIRSA